MELEGLAITTWYKAGLAVSATILASSILASNHGASLIAAGGVLFCLGEWINHPKRIEMRPAEKLTIKTREANAGGTIFNIAGLAVAGLGVYKILVG